ncbi:hypothetical protein FJ867_16555 [Mesorhizobium sp. B2-5-3]|nr:hypothetical protein FJ867_16555 [Mesorhizobium sp. B2-5-3]
MEWVLPSMQFPDPSAREHPPCPAGHLPRKGGDWLSVPHSPIFNAAMRMRTSTLPISPLRGRWPAGQRGCCPADLSMRAHFVSFSLSALSRLSLPMTIGVNSTSFSFGSVLSLA